MKPLPKMTKAHAAVALLAPLYPREKKDEGIENPHDPSIPDIRYHPPGIDPEPEPSGDVRVPGPDPLQEPKKSDAPPRAWSGFATAA